MSKLRIDAFLSERHFDARIKSVFGAKTDRSTFHFTREIQRY